LTKSLVRCTGLLAVAVVTTACVSLPPGPSVMVLPGSTKGFDEFAADDAVCRDWAGRQVGTTTQRAATESGVTAAAIATGVGAAAGAAIGGAVGEAGAGAAIGAGSGLLLGSAAGADRAAWAAGRCAAALRRSLPAVHVCEGQPDPRGGRLGGELAACARPSATAARAAAAATPRRRLSAHQGIGPSSLK